MKLIICAILLLGIIPHTLGQQFNQLKGRILDSQSNPIPFSHVHVVSENTGTLSNETGNFSIVITKLPLRLSVSHIGYATTEIEINEITQNLIINLEDDVKKLNEIVIKGLTARDVVLHAIDALRSNYLIDTLGYTLFTQFTKKTKTNPLLIQEFVHYLYSIRGVQNEAYIVKSRSKSFGKTGNELQRKSRVTPVLASESDLILKYRVNFLEKNKTKRYEYSYLEDITYNNQLVYRIKVESTKNNFAIGGEVWIHPENFGIAYVKANYQNEEFDDMSTSNRYKEIFYEQNETKWFLSHSVHSLTILPKGATEKIYSNRLSVVISKTQGTHLPKGEKLQYHIEKSRKFRVSFNSDFWDSYNYVPISEPFKSLLTD